MKKWKLDRIFTLITVGSSLITVILVLKKPQPVSQPMPAAVAAAKAESFQEKLGQFTQPKQPGQPAPELRMTSDEVAAALAQAAGEVPATPVQINGTTVNMTPSSADAAVAPGQPEVKDYQVNFDGDVARGQFLVKIAGRDVWVTLAGHLGSKDGYATFDPTEFKLGDMNVPISLISEAFQKKLTEQRDRLKLPDNVDTMKVENGELVLTQK